MQLKTKLAEFEQKREEQNIPRIEIKCVEFANFNNDNKIIDDYGIPMRVGLYYLTPRMTIDTNFYLSERFLWNFSNSFPLNSSYVASSL